MYWWSLRLKKGSHLVGIVFINLTGDLINVAVTATACDKMTIFMCWLQIKTKTPYNKFEMQFHSWTTQVITQVELLLTICSDLWAVFPWGSVKNVPLLRKDNCRSARCSDVQGFSVQIFPLCKYFCWPNQSQLKVSIAQNSWAGKLVPITVILDYQKFRRQKFRRKKFVVRNFVLRKFVVRIFVVGDYVL